jgi:hypothetical protein
VDSLYLVKNGVPFDVAFALPLRDRVAWIVALGMLNGGIYDWTTRRWIDQ